MNATRDHAQSTPIASDATDARPWRQRLFVSAGQRFGCGVILDPDVRIPGYRAAKLLCDCGIEYVATLTHLSRGRVRSCGHLQREAASKTANTAARAANTRHGLNWHPLAHIWRGMITRCENPASRIYPGYGGRGITVCNRWHDVRLFIEDIERDLGQRPDGRSLDRIDNDGNYEPGNVRWATAAQQAQNRRGTKLTDSKVRAIRQRYAAGDLTFAQLAAEFDIGREAARDVVRRLTWRDEGSSRAGRSLIVTAADGAGLRQRRESRGMTVRALAAASGVSYATIGRLEGGSGVRTRISNLEALAMALDVDPRTLCAVVPLEPSP